MNKDELQEYIRSNFDKTLKEERVPNTVVQYYGKDQPGLFNFGKPGNDTFSSHLSQDYDWTQHEITYKWNSLGLRGPEPNFDADTKLLVAGGSVCVGTGMPLELTFPHMLAERMGADYVNLSDYDSFSDVITELLDFGQQYQPTHIVLMDPRFIGMSGWALNYFLMPKKSPDLERIDRHFYQSVLQWDNNLFLKMMDSYLTDLFPRTEIIHYYALGRKQFQNTPEYKYIKPVLMDKSHIIDLARDGSHPGLRSHQLITDLLYNELR
jgi:hypothetical protein